MTSWLNPVNWIPGVGSATEPTGPPPPLSGKSTFSKNNKGHATVLVIQSDDYNWEDIFSGRKLIDGTPIVAVQTGWEDIIAGPCCNSITTKGVPVTVMKRTNKVKTPEQEKELKRQTVVVPDFVLIRNEVSTPQKSHLNQLMGLMYSNVNSINSLMSIFLFTQKAIVQAELNKIRNRLGQDVFPLIPQEFFPSHQSALYGNTFPAVVKIGTAHAGYGKMKIPNHKDMEDFRSILAMHTDYCFAEPFINGEYDLRIQKIGPHYRVFKRRTLVGNWKTNTGTSHLDEIAVSDRYRLWADEASKLFGGLTICTVDAIVTPEGEEYILEVNGTASGLDPANAAEDNKFIADSVIAELNRLLESTTRSTATKEVKEKEKGKEVKAKIDPPKSPGPIEPDPKAPKKK